jgi:hypothetical protein
LDRSREYEYPHRHDRLDDSFDRNSIVTFEDDDRYDDHRMIHDADE